MSEIPRTAITALILAGGQATRMGGRDKGLIECAGQPLIEHTLRRVAPLVGSILISANRNQNRYGAYGYPVLDDERADYPGPLAGIERGLQACSSDYLWVLPCDAPAFDAELLQRLAQTCIETQAVAAVPDDTAHVHATFALLRVDALKSLRTYLDAGERKVQDWLAALPAARVDCSDHPEWFVNINTPDDLNRYAEQLRLNTTS